MGYAIETISGGVVYLLNLMKMIQAFKVCWGGGATNIETHRQQGDLICRLLLFQNVRKLR
jgi:hypothetical protein